MADLIAEFEKFIDGRMPTKYVVCPQCQGHGTQDCFGRNGVPSEWFDEPDFAEDYTSGTYSAPCDECSGLRVVREVDRDAVPEKLLQEWDAWVDEYNHYMDECAAEARYFGHC